MPPSFVRLVGRALIGPALASGLVLLAPGSLHGQEGAQKGGTQRGAAEEPAATSISLRRVEDRVRVLVGAELFTELRDQGLVKPALYPIRGAAGKAVQRDYPFELGANEAKDHPHHTSLWFAHGDVNGHDFWHGAIGRAWVERRGLELDAERATIHASYVWLVGKERRRLAHELRSIRFAADKDGSRSIDIAIRIVASDETLRFGDTKEGSMALRVTPSLRLRGKVAKGRILNSGGLRDNKCWGKRAKWVDYSGPVDGTIVGVACFDHPKNHGHPCRWHARNYGLFAANPWGVRHFVPKAERKRARGGMTLAKGRTIELRYLWLFHPGHGDADALERGYAAFVRSESPAASFPKSLEGAGADRRSKDSKGTPKPGASKGK